MHIIPWTHFEINSMETNDLFCPCEADSRTQLNCWTIHQVDLYHVTFFFLIFWKKFKVQISRTSPQSANKAEPTLAVKPRGDITRGPKRVSVVPQRGLMSSKNIKIKSSNITKIGIFQFSQTHALFCRLARSTIEGWWKPKILMNLRPKKRKERKLRL